MAADGNRGFTGSEDTCRSLDWVSTVSDLTRNCSEKAADVFRLAFHFSSENQRIETQLASLVAGGFNQKPIVRDDVILDDFEDGISGLRCFRNFALDPLLQPVRNGLRNLDAIFLNDSESVGKRGRVRRAWDRRQ